MQAQSAVRITLIIWIQPGRWISMIQLSIVHQEITCHVQFSLVEVNANLHPVREISIGLKLLFITEQ